MGYSNESFGKKNSLKLLSSNTYTQIDDYREIGITPFLPLFNNYRSY